MYGDARFKQQVGVLNMQSLAPDSLTFSLRNVVHCQLIMCIAGCSKAHFGRMSCQHGTFVKLMRDGRKLLSSLTVIIEQAGSCLPP